GLVGVLYWILLRSFSPATSEPGSGGNNVRPDERATFDIALPREQCVEVAAHVANADDSVGEKQRQKDLLAPGWIRIHTGQMDVHVPQAGDQDFAGSVDASSVLWDFQTGCWADRDDTAIVDHDGLIGPRRAAGGVDQSDVGND